MHANLPTTELLPAPSCAKPDIVRRFLAWAQSAEADARAQGASALARAYLYSDLTASVRAEAVLAMTALIDDPSVWCAGRWRRLLCRAHDAPRALVLALAADEPEAAAPVLQHSPVLTDADLVDCVGERRRRRPDGAGAPAVPAASRKSRAGRDRTIRRGSRAHRQSRDRSSGETAAAAFLPASATTPSLRDALLERPALPAALRARIVVAAAKDLAVEASQWMSRLASRARRPRGARSGDLHDRLVMPPRRAGGAYARAARSRRAHAGLAAAFAAWRRTGLCSRRRWRNCRACRCRASPPLSSSRRGKALPRSPAGLA